MANHGISFFFFCIFFFFVLLWHIFKVEKHSFFFF